MEYAAVANTRDYERPENVPSGFTMTTIQQLGELACVLASTQERLSKAAIHVFGPQPEGATDGREKVREVPKGAAHEIGDTLRRLIEQAHRLENTAAGLTGAL